MGDVAVVVIDTLRLDYFERYFSDLPGKFFSNCYSNSHWTVPSHASLFTGQQPSEVNVTAKSPSFHPDDPPLAAQLSNSGYETQLLTANPQFGYWSGWTEGFDRVSHPHNLLTGNPQSVDWYSITTEVEQTGLRRYLTYLSRALQPKVATIDSLQEAYRLFTSHPADGGIETVIRRLANRSLNTDFLFINVMDCHNPYRHPTEPSQQINALVGDGFANSIEKPTLIRDGYDASVSSTAERYQTLHNILQDEFEYVITLSDHGELLGEYGHWNHGYGVYPELVEIPCLISGAGVENSTEQTPVDLRDVYRTIGELMDVNLTGVGRSLVKTIPAQELWTEYHGFTKQHAEQFERKGIPEVFERHDTPLVGKVDTDGNYRYQTHGSEGDKDLRTRQTMVAEHLTSEDHADRDISQHLRDLGYG